MLQRTVAAWLGVARHGIRLAANAQYDLCDEQQKHWERGIPRNRPEAPPYAVRVLHVMP